MALIFHISRGMALSRTLGSQMIPQASRALTAAQTQKPFTTSVVCRAREYGPQATEERIDEVHHWVKERYVAIALIPIIPTALAFPNLATDMILSSALVLHCHWRFSGVAHDYIHGRIMPVIAKWIVIALSMGAFGGLAYFNYFDVGFAGAARMLYSQL